MNRTTKINILAYASEPDKNYKYEGDIVDYKGKRYFVSLAEERVEFIVRLWRFEGCGYCFISRN